MKNTFYATTNRVLPILGLSFFCLLAYQNCSNFQAQTTNSQTPGNPNLDIVTSSFAGSSCQSNDHRPYNIAHRGNEAEWLENSMPAFLSAAQLGADFVELDVVYTKDNVALIFHDHDLNRGVLVCDGIPGSTLIKDLNYSQLRACSLQGRLLPQATGILSDIPAQSTNTTTEYNHQKAPILDEVLQALAKTSTGILIEMKARPNGVAGTQLLDQLARLDPNKECANPETASAQALQASFGCYQRLQLQSFDRSYMTDLYRAIRNNSQYSHLRALKILKLYGTDKNQVQQMQDPQYAHDYWDNSDGIAINLNLGESQYSEQALKDLIEKLNCNFPPARGKLKYVGTAYSNTTLLSAVNTGVHGVILARPRLFPRLPTELQKPYAQMRAGENVFMAGEILDLGHREGPSQWKTINRNVAQTSNILGPYGPQNANRIPFERGTQFLLGTGALNKENLPKDFKITMVVRNHDNDGIGIIFNRESSQNNLYSYALEWDKEIQKIALYRIHDTWEGSNLRVSGRILAERQMAYEINQDYNIVVERKNNNVLIYVENEKIFDVNLQTADSSPLGLQHGGLAGPFTRGHQATISEFKITTPDEPQAIQYTLRGRVEPSTSYITDTLNCERAVGNNPSWPNSEFCKKITLNVLSINKPEQKLLSIYAKRNDGTYAGPISCSRAAQFTADINWIKDSPYTFEVYEGETCQTRQGQPLSSLRVQPF